MTITRLLLPATTIGLLLLAAGPNPQAASADGDITAQLAAINGVGPKGQGHQQAMRAWSQLSKAPASDLPTILAGVKEDAPLATNWIRAAVEAIVARATAAGETIPVKALTVFVNDTQHAPRARRLAFEIIHRADESAAKQLIRTFLDDPSLELRRLAVAQQLAIAAQLPKEKPASKKALAAVYRRALTAARDLDQIKEATARLRELGEPVDLPQHFGWVMNWKLIGPFDHAEGSGWDVAYPPEKRIDLAAKYEGKDGKPLTWIDHATEDDYGVVDLNKALGKHKGAIAYAYAEFVSPEPRDVEIRLGCINGNKVWLNGKLLTANHVYHSGMSIDQYRAPGRLKKGLNTILVKVAQNEQTENWAQRWQFQLRVSDKYGAAVLAENRGQRVRGEVMSKKDSD